MTALALAPIDPWRLEILTTRGCTTSTQRGALARDAARGLLIRLCAGAYVERMAFESLSPEQQHLVRIRAHVALSLEPLRISHWSAGVVHRRPVLRSRLTAVHTTVGDDVERHRAGVVTHRFAVSEDELVRVGDVWVTTEERTAIDIAAATRLEEGVLMMSDLLRSGVPRERLEAAAELAGPRRASRRIAEAVAMGHPRAESVAESRTWVSLMRSGFEVPELQHLMLLSDGSEAWLDALLRRVRVGIETDGLQKYLDAQMAPAGPARAVLQEKRREDEVRLGLQALVRPGWVQSGSPTLLRTLLARVGVHPTSPRTPFAAYCEAAAAARPRRRLR